MAAIDRITQVLDQTPSRSRLIVLSRLIDPELLLSNSSGIPPYTYYNKPPSTGASVPPATFDSIAYGQGPNGAFFHQRQRLPRRGVERLPLEDWRESKVLKTCGEDARPSRRERFGAPIQEMPDASWKAHRKM